MKDFIIDPEFAGYMFDTSALTDAELEASIVATGGPTDPLQIAVIQGENILMDGHRRHAIAERLGLPFTTVERPFATRADALAEMDSIQLRRRNLNSNQESIVRARLLKHRVEAGVVIPEECTAAKTTHGAAVDAVAEEAGVSTRTVLRDEEYLEATEKLDKELKYRAMGEFSKKDVILLAELPPEDQVAVVAEYDAGEYTSLRAAIQGEADVDDVVDVPEPKKEKEPPAADVETARALAQRWLGKLKDAIHDVNAAQPDPTKRKVLEMHVAKISDLLKAW
jgi:hypothetical protein